MEQDNKAPSLEDNLKKALTELLVLHLFSLREHYIGELTGEIAALTGGRLSVVFPYAAIYRMVKAGHIREVPRRTAPDGRLRQYYRITDAGLEYLSKIKQTYAEFSEHVARILSWKGEEQ